jgi:hypothetical protein
MFDSSKELSNVTYGGSGVRQEPSRLERAQIVGKRAPIHRAVQKYSRGPRNPARESAVEFPVKIRGRAENQPKVSVNLRTVPLNDLMGRTERERAAKLAGGLLSAVRSH